jgi:UDP-N-acetyl-2-amino-2-deoxyglucuronate dehydrogenase
MLHVGILGGGNISETHARAASEAEGVRVAAVCGPNREKVARLGERYGGAVYERVEEFLGHNPLDAVLVGSPSGLHAEQGVAAARRGLHVLVEKPLDIKTERAVALVEECERAGVKLGVFFQDRVAEGVVRLKAMLDEGVLGRPMLAAGRVRWYRPPEYYAGSRWRGTWALDGGGALMNQGVHTVDLLLWLLGDVRKVYARAATTLHRIEVEDTVVATLEFASGALGTLEATTAAYPGYPRRVELTGTEGTAVLEGDRLAALDLRTPAAEGVVTAEGSPNASATSAVVSDVSGHRKILEDFVYAIEVGGRPVCDGREGMRSVELVEAVYESSRTGRAVTLSSG